MEPKLLHTCLTEALTLPRESLFSNQRYVSLGKLNFFQNCVFPETWVQKGLPPDQENHLRLKNIFIREYLWNLSFSIPVLLKL